MRGANQRHDDDARRRARRLDRALWIAQALLALTLVGGGLWKLITPIPELAATMPWMGQVAPTFLHITAVLDLAGGLGVVLPSLTRIAPRLTVVAALATVGLMGGAIVFHIQRNEAADTPFNVVVAAMAAFVAWGRLRVAALPPRRPDHAPT